MAIKSKIPIGRTRESRSYSTRERVLDAAREITREKGEMAATMSAVAAKAGISRQALYLHFADRVQLLHALSDHIDRQLGVGDWMIEIENLPSVTDMLRNLALMRCKRSVEFAFLIRSIDTDRFRNDSAATAWKKRHYGNIDWMERVVVERLRQEGRLHPSWLSRDAAAFLVALYSMRNWDDLTQTFGWSSEQYIETIAASAMSILTGPARLANPKPRAVRRITRGTQRRSEREPIGSSRRR